MNVVTMKPAGLDALTDQINDALARREHSKEEWVDATVDLCRYVADARAKFKDNQSFGKWFDASGIRLERHDLTAAIAMGKEIERAREILGNTQRRSLQTIHSREFRSPNVRRMPKPKKTNEKLEKALHAYDRRKLAGEELTYEAIQQEAGVSSTPVRRAIAMREAEEKVAKEAAAGLSMSAQQKLDAAIRSAVKRLELEAETRARDEARRIVGDMMIPHYLETLKKVEEMLKWKRGIMSRADYRKIIRCLHPDTGQHVSDANRNEAFRLFTQYEAKLVDDAEQADLKRISTLPKTVAELMARRRKK